MVFYVDMQVHFESYIYSDILESQYQGFYALIYKTTNYVGLTHLKCNIRHMWTRQHYSGLFSYVFSARVFQFNCVSPTMLKRHKDEKNSDC